MGPAHPAARIAAHPAVPVGLGAFGLHAATACRTVYFGDSGELIAAAHCLGVAHPPGYPLYTLLGNLALRLPLGEAAWRMNLLSALFAALTCALVAALVYRWTSSTAAALGGGGALAVSSVFWSVATVAEVYTLHTCLVAGLLLCAERLHGARDRHAAVSSVLAGALVVGLGLSHRPTILLALPAAWLLARPRAERPRVGWRGWLPAGVIVAAVPALSYGTLVLRSSLGPAVNWGRPDEIPRLIAHITARSYGFYVLGPAGWSRPEAWERVADLVWSGSGYVGAVLGLIGLVATLSGKACRRNAGWALVALGLAGLLFGLSYGTDDVEVLFLPVCLATALAVGAGIAACAAVAGRHRRVAALVLAGAAILLPAALHLPQRNLRAVTAAADYGRDMLATVPSGGLLFVEGDDAFLLAYLIDVLGERRDVTVYDRLGLMFRDELEEPGSSVRAGESPLRYRVRREQERIRSELVGATPRAVTFMSWPGYALPEGYRFEPVGLLYFAGLSDSPPRDPAGLRERYHEERVLAQASTLDDPLARTVAATYALMRGERRLFEGDRAGAWSEFDRAEDLAGESESILNYLGTIYGRNGELERAILTFELAVRARPTSPRAWNNLGLARRLSGDVEGARQAWRRSLELDPLQPETAAQLRELPR